jgi:hypothetical protein
MLVLTVITPRSKKVEKYQVSRTLNPMLEFDPSGRIVFLDNEGEVVILKTEKKKRYIFSEE